MVDLRAATPDDAEAVTAIYAPYVVTNAVSFETRAPTVKEMRSRIVAAGDVHPWIVATESNVILGYAFAKPFRPGPTHRFGVEVAVYAAGELEGKGIRRTLLSSLLMTLTEQNFTQAACGGSPVAQGHPEGVQGCVEVGHGRCPFGWLVGVGLVCVAAWDVSPPSVALSWCRTAEAAEGP